MSFVDKKENFANLLEQYANGESDKLGDLQRMIEELKFDEDFRDKDLFKNIFLEFEKGMEEFSRKEIKQRVLMIRSFSD